MKTIHLIYDVYFRIEAGYNDGHMSREQHDRFYTEIRALFSRAGFTILENPPGCPSFQLGTTCLYCHPTELSGPVEEPHIALVERVLQQGTSFQYQTTDRYDRLYDFTVEEELAYYRQHYSEQLFLEAFRTSDPSKYHLRDEVLVVFQKVCLGRRLQILQICKYSDSCFQIHTPRRVDLIFVL